MNSNLSCSFFILIVFSNLYPNHLKASSEIPQSLGLVNVANLDSSLKIDMAYSTKINFTEKKVTGYLKNICYLKEKAALAIVRVNDILKKQSPAYRLSLRDCWRPHRATLNMIEWAKQTDEKKLFFSDLNDFQKNTFQDPQLFEKGILRTERLLELGYLSSLSNHSRGSTVDLEIEVYNEDTKGWTTLEMGTKFDTFAPSSAHFADLGNPINQRRSQLKQLMNQQGFASLAKEWWHWIHQASNEGPILDGEIR